MGLGPDVLQGKRVNTDNYPTLYFTHSIKQKILSQ